MKVIGVDLDDVLLDFLGHICIFHNEKYGTNYKRSDVWDFHLDKIWGYSREEALEEIADFYESEEHENALPIFGAPEIVKKLSENNNLIIVTSRPEYLKERTSAWLQKYFPGIFKDLRFNNEYHGDGVKRKKSEVCKEIGAEYYIEDMILNAEEVAKSGIPVLLLDSPWNQGEVSSGITRVKSWDEIYEILK